MSDVFRIYGAELSPFSVKVRSYFRYKKIPHEWIVRSADKMEEFSKYAKLPLIPAVATPEGDGLQDSTPIIEKMETRFPDPSIHPDDPTLAFLSALLEEFGDEWGNKWMFHYRWARPADQDSAAGRLARTMMPGQEDAQYDEMAAQIKSRMVDRVWFVGSNADTAPQIEATFAEFLMQLDTHLTSRPYLFGARPSFADFGVWGQVYNAWTDPTCKEIIEGSTTNVVPWLQRMLEPTSEGDFESWSSLESTLMPIITDHVGGLFLPWSDANAKALAGESEEYSVTIRSGQWTQKPQKYHARSLKALRERYAAVGDKSSLDPILNRAGCLGWLSG
jgi:glutathione S-transferase